ncbi:MAG: phage tail tube protein [Tepidisphaeraceae bacterium]
MDTGFGKILEYSDTGSGTWTKASKTVEIEIPDAELGAEESTHDDSTDYHREYIPTLYDPGTLPFTYRYEKAAFALIEAVFQLANTSATRASATKFWRLTLPDGSKVAWKGFITKHGLPTDIDGVLTCECEMQVIGKRTFTPAA